MAEAPWSILWKRLDKEGVITGKCILYSCKFGGQPCLVSYAGVDCEHIRMSSGNGANLQPLTQDPS